MNRDRDPGQPHGDVPAAHGSHPEAAAQPAQSAAAPSGHAAMLRQWIWRDFANAILGAWLVVSPATLGYRDAAMTRSDVVTGILIVALAGLTLSPRFDAARWALCGAGVWLLFAPLVFWSRDAGAYANDTLVGALVIAFSVLIPMMPSRAHHEVMTGPGPDTPPGWSYNPSDWMQRGPLIAMALIGLFLSRYLAAYQLGHVPHPWDPFFGDGTRRVLESEVSRAWPISDAGLGATSYMLEALSGFMGGRNRWRTMPWMVLMFGFLVVPLGVVSIVLVVLQPVAVGAWCTLCLVTAVAMLVMIAPAVDEVVAMVQFLAGARAEGKPLWRTFWVGGTLERYPRAEAAVAPGAERWARRTTASKLVAAMDLDRVPWNLLACTPLGLWLMAAPAALRSVGAAAHSDHLAGALVVTWSVIAFGQVARPVRLLNLPTGLWIAAAPWLLSGATGTSRWNGLLVGAAVAALSLRRGPIAERFGAWNRYLV